MTSLGLSDDIDGYLKLNWRSFTFTSVLYVFNFLGLIHILINRDKPINFDLIATWAYRTWIIVGLVTPILFVLSIIMMFKANGRVRLMGIWLRLASNSGLFSCMLAFWIAGWDLQRNNETYIYAGYLISAILFYTFLILFKNFCMIGRVHLDAQRISRSKQALNAR